MKKIALFVLLVASLFVLAPKSRAQDFNFEKAYQDYIFTQSNYADSFKAYQNAKDAYQKNSTLSLKEDARVKTLSMLKSRDELYKVYLTALRMKINETKGLTTDEKVKQFERIDNEVAWFTSHQKNYSDSDSLENLFSRSKEVEDHYKLDTERRIYDALFNISLGEIIGLRLDHADTYTKVTKEIDQAVTDGKVRIDPFNRWFTDIENTTNEIKNQEDAAKTQIDRIYTEGYSQPATVFRTSGKPLGLAKDALLTLNSYLEELLTSFNSNLNGTAN